jgi:hypothetical protein
MLAGLGVGCVRAVRTMGARSQNVLGWVGDGNWSDADAVRIAVEGEAAKDDNRRKLAALGGGELFV